MLSCATGIYDRQKVFRKLLGDDWVMLIALGLLIHVACLAQIYLKDIYMLISIFNAEVIPGPNVPAEARGATQSARLWPLEPARLPRNLGH